MSTFFIINLEVSQYGKEKNQIGIGQKKKNEIDKRYFQW